MTTNLTAENLARYRTETDPIAERVIDVIYQSGVEHVNEVFASLTRNRHPDLENLPKVVQDYFKEYSSLPDWVDYNKLALGSRMYELFCPEISMLLFFHSLPATYSCWRGAAVLVNTGRMVEHHHSIKIFTSRLMETSQFVMDVMRRDAFLEQGFGITMVLKVRLIHAAIRHFIRLRGNWDIAEMGEAINHQDMAGTYLSFSAFILEELDKLKFGITPEEQEAYYHTWRVVAHLMGLPKELMPATYGEGLKLGHWILSNQQGESDYGKTLTAALVEFVNDTAAIPFLKNRLADSSIYFFCGKDICKMIGIKNHSNILLFLIWLVQRLYALTLKLFNRNLNSPIVRIILPFNRRFMSRLILKFNEDKKISFDLPPSLRDEWATK